MQHKDVINEWQGALEFFCCNMLYIIEGVFLELFLTDLQEGEQTQIKFIMQVSV